MLRNKQEQSDVSSLSSESDGEAEKVGFPGKEENETEKETIYNTYGSTWS